MPAFATCDCCRRLTDEFFVFANERLEPSGRCHERDIVRAFRSFYPRYRQRDMGRTADGLSLPDDDIADLVRSWNAQVRTRFGGRHSWRGV